MKTRKSNHPDDQAAMKTETELTDEEINQRVHDALGKPKMFLLKKRGFWWRPNSAGYTSEIARAGLYTEQEATEREHVNGHDDDVTKHPAPIENYAGDLNLAITLFPDPEKHITEAYNFVEFLREECGADKGWEYDDCIAIARATARPYCLAFLRTKGAV